ncbi:hypothetical protein, partial [Neisseria sp. HMSC065D04]|uniref:hypothetical protein n=1 Tax=Neisseria sp. HMSC065D04 TaxID=1739542 RepID=UPI001AEFEB7D
SAASSPCPDLSESTINKPTSVLFAKTNFIAKPLVHWRQYISIMPMRFSLTPFPQPAKRLATGRLKIQKPIFQTT